MVCFSYTLCQIFINQIKQVSEWVNQLLNVTINDISVIYVTAHRCAGGLKKKWTYGRAPNAIDIS